MWRVSSAAIKSTCFSVSSARRVISFRLPIGVAYGSDIDLVSDLLLKAATDCDLVMNTPKAEVWFTEFGDSSLNFDLVCWLQDAVIKDRTVDKLNRAIDALFRADNIEIPFPQRDLHIKSSVEKIHT